MTKHWAENSTYYFEFAVAMDFLCELETVMDERNISRKKLAEKLNVSEGSVSQLFNNPGNLTLGTTVKLARALSLKVALVAYDDGDKQNEKGPVFSGIFRKCWENVGKPIDGWQLEDAFPIIEPISTQENVVSGTVKNPNSQQR